MYTLEYVHQTRNSKIRLRRMVVYLLQQKGFMTVNGLPYGQTKKQEIFDFYEKMFGKKPTKSLLKPKKFKKRVSFSQLGQKNTKQMQEHYQRYGGYGL